MTRVLRLGAFRRLFVAYTLNEIALSLGVLTLALLVYRRTGNAIGATGFFLCAQFLPALLSPALVARLDQRSARAVLPALYALEGVAFGLLAWLAHSFVLAPVLVLTVVDGLLAVTARALARTATVAVLSPAGLLREGNALINGAFSVCYMVGPALAGAVVALGGTVAALIANAAVYGCVALILATSAGLPGALPNAAPGRGRLRAAINHARTQLAIRRLLGVQALGLVFFTMSIPIEVVFAQHTLHSGAGGYGVLLSAWGLGTVLGSAIYARWRRLPLRSLIALGCALLGIGLAAMAVSPSLAMACVASAVAGAGNGIEAVSARTALQEAVTAPWMARMMSLNESIFQAVPGAGILLGGAIVALAGSRVALGVAGVGSLAMTALVWALLVPAAEPAQGPAQDLGVDDASPRRRVASR